MKTRLLPLLLMLLPACDPAGLADDAGFETGPCIEGGCFEDLACLSDLCVMPDEAATTGPNVATGPGQTSAGSGSPDPSESGSGPADSGPETTGAEETTGSDPTGADPTGSETTGADPTGADPTGADPTGADPTGADPTGGVPGAPCDPYLQDCPAGEKCNAWSDNGGSNWNALGCFPVEPNPGQPGDSCTVEGSGVSGYDSCDVGSMCWDVDAQTNAGTCVAMCEGSAAVPTCGDPAATCSIANDGVINLCLPGCDPLSQNCPANQGCYPIDDGFVCAPDASGDGGLPGEGCAFINACSPGNACIDVGAYGLNCGAGCCSPLCHVDGAAACPEPGQSCVPWFEVGAAPPGLETIGVCAVP